MRWNSDSSYDNYWDDIQHNTGFDTRLGQLHMILADKHNWLKPEDTHLDPEMLVDVLTTTPELLSRVVNQNLHLCRTIDRNKAEAEAEEEHLHQQIKASDRIIEELQQELNGYKTLQKLTEDSSDETIISN